MGAHFGIQDFDNHGHGEICRLPLVEGGLKLVLDGPRSLSFPGVGA